MRSLLDMHGAIGLYFGQIGWECRYNTLGLSRYVLCGTSELQKSRFQKKFITTVLHCNEVTIRSHGAHMRV